MFIEVNNKAANHATRAEMGRFPIQISIFSLILKYYIYLNGKVNNSIVKQALIISQELRSKSHNSYPSKILEILKSCNPCLSRQPDKLTNLHISELISSVKNKYREFWKHKIESSSKLDFYRKVNHNFSSEKYLDIVQNFNDLLKKDYVKLQISNHSLPIETKRYSRPKIPRENRICEFCHLKEVEDETHLLFYCSRYTIFRDTFMDKMKAILNTVPEHKDSFLRTNFAQIMTMHYFI